MQFSLRTLLIFITLAGVLCWVAYLVTRPYLTEARVSCGNGRYVELLRPNEFFCDQSGPLHFRFTGMAHPEHPPFCCFWPCGYDPGFVGVPGASANVIGVASANNSDEFLLMIDFKTGAHWPNGRDRNVTPEAERMLESLRGRNSQTWLWSTYDGRFTKP